jgi:hypothetical protein
MEPDREEQKPEGPRPEEKPKRFHLIKLEERIAPGKVKDLTWHCTQGPTSKHCGSGGDPGTLSIE